LRVEKFYDNNFNNLCYQNATTFFKEKVRLGTEIVDQNIYFAYLVMNVSLCEYSFMTLYLINQNYHILLASFSKYLISIKLISALRGIAVYVHWIFVRFVCPPRCLHARSFLFLLLHELQPLHFRSFN